MRQIEKSTGVLFGNRRFHNPNISAGWRIQLSIQRIDIRATNIQMRMAQADGGKSGDIVPMLIR